MARGRLEEPRIVASWIRAVAALAGVGVIALAWTVGGATSRPGTATRPAPAGRSGGDAPTPSAAAAAPGAVPGGPTADAPTPPPADPRLPYTADEKMLLSKAKRILIWEEENHYHQLTTKVFPGWERALKTADAAAYRDAAAPGFRARFEVASRAPALGRLGALVWGAAAAAPDGGPVGDVDGMVAGLLALRREFATVVAAKWAVTSLKPLDPARYREGGWEGRIQLDLRGTLPSGVRAETNLKCRVVTGPLAADMGGVRGWLLEADALSVRRVQAADPAAPGPLLEETTATAGVVVPDFHDNWTRSPWVQVTGGVFVEDYDRDGALDLLVTDLHRIALLRGRGDGTFEDRTAGSGLPAKPEGSTYFALWADFDADGLPDLVLGHHVYRNLGAGRFDDLGDRASLPLPPGVTNLVAGDYDADGRVDVYACTAGGRGGVMRSSWIDDRAHPPNELYRNVGSFHFQNTTAATGTGDRGACFTAVWLDADGNRFPDLYVANEVGQNALFLNDGTVPFRKVDPDGTRWGGFSMGVDAGDVDGDGATDLYVANMYSKAGSRIIGLVEPSDYPEGLYAKIRDFVTGNRLYVGGDGKGGFRETAQEAGCNAAGWAYGVRMLDLDGDGALDLYSTAGHKSVTRTEPDG